MSGVIQFGFQIVATDKIAKPVAQEPLNDNGLSGDLVAGDGIFSGRSGGLELGSYKLSVVAKGPTFQRSQQVPFTVKPRLIDLNIKQENAVFEEDDASGGGAVEVNNDNGVTKGSKSKDVLAGDQRSEILVSLSKEAQLLRGIEVKLVALSANREQIELELKGMPGALKAFSAKAGQLPKSGRYRIKAILNGHEKGGNLIEAESRVVVFNYTFKSEPVSAKQNEELVQDSSEDHKHNQEGDNNTEVTSPIPVAILSVFNLLLFVLGFKLIKQRNPSALVSNNRYSPPAQLMETLESFEERASSTVVSFKDPIFKLLEEIVSRGNVIESAQGDLGVERAGEPIDTQGEQG
jgi:hypothetical protein